MIPGISKLRQYILFLVVFGGLLATGRFGSSHLPEHSYFDEVTLKCHPLRRIPHKVSMKGTLPWDNSWFEPQRAQDQILETLTRFHQEHVPPLKPRKGWPTVEVLSVERSKETEGGYIVHWQSRYDVEACQKLTSARTERESLTALVHTK